MIKNVSFADDVEDIYTEAEWVLISGWGSTVPQRRKKRGPQRIQVAMIPIINDTECRRAHPDGIDNSMFCAGKLGVGGVDTCQGSNSFFKLLATRLNKFVRPSILPLVASVTKVDF